MAPMLFRLTDCRPVTESARVHSRHPRRDAFALVMDDAELDPTALPIEVLAAACRGDAAAASHVRRRLGELDLPFELHLR